MDAADHCLDHLSGADSTWGNELHGALRPINMKATIMNLGSHDGDCPDDYE